MASHATQRTGATSCRRGLASQRSDSLSNMTLSLLPFASFYPA
ncbi:hypothetical protein HMPREF1503_0728 [Olsenella uli MSTE5]|nr:hypothetical protein HMPREF1503_0728 [Olsenella uli MSTE5]